MISMYNITFELLRLHKLIQDPKITKKYAKIIHKRLKHVLKLYSKITFHNEQHRLELQTIVYEIHNAVIQSSN